jgi:uncharacterized protein YbjT (DUF2867 family)
MNVLVFGATGPTGSLVVEEPLLCEVARILGRDASAEGRAASRTAHHRNRRRELEAEWEQARQAVWDTTRLSLTALLPS